MARVSNAITFCKGFVAVLVNHKHWQWRMGCIESHAKCAWSSHAHALSPRPRKQVQGE